MSDLNPNCDGNKCLDPNGPVKLYPLPGNGNLILCMACWANENRYRHVQGVHYKRPEDWPQLDWTKAEIYEGAQ